MSENKTDSPGLTINQAKGQIAQLENEYNKKLMALQKAERAVSAATKECLESLQTLTMSQTQFFKGVIDIQNKQLAEKNELPAPVKTPKKSARRDNVDKETSV